MSGEHRRSSNSRVRHLQNHFGRERDPLQPALTTARATVEGVGVFFGGGGCRSTYILFLEFLAEDVSELGCTHYSERHFGRIIIELEKKRQNNNFKKNLIYQTGQRCGVCVIGDCIQCRRLSQVVSESLLLYFDFRAVLLINVTMTSHSHTVTVGVHHSST